MTKNFRWSDEEFQRVAEHMYKLMTAGRSSIIDYWPAFKLAQSSACPVYKYSINAPNTDVMKELRRRVTLIFTNCKNKVEVVEVIDQDAAKAKALTILKHIKAAERRQATIQSGALHRKLLTGNTVEALDHEVDIIITTDCPGKYVIVDLETGEQYSSSGSPVRSSSDTVISAFRSQRKVKPIRKVTIPKPVKKAKK